MILTLVTIASITAAILVSRNKPLAANCIWAVSNLYIIHHNLYIGQYELAALFIAYEIIAVYGVYNLRRDNARNT